MPWSMKTRRPDDGARMDLDAGEEARDVRAHARKPAQAHRPQRVVHLVQLQRVEARIARDDLEHGPRGGIAFEDAADVFTDTAEHGQKSRIPE
jgi:hypothetical protein